MNSLRVVPNRSFVKKAKKKNECELNKERIRMTKMTEYINNICPRLKDIYMGKLSIRRSEICIYPTANTETRKL